MDLPQNITYKNLSGAIAPMLQASKEIGASVSAARRRSKKAIDVSKYQDFTKMLGKYSGGQTGTANSTPSVMGKNMIETTPYMGFTKFESQHPGTDFVLGDIGTPVTSFVPGTVEEVKTGQVKGSPGFGNYVLVRDQNGNLHRFSHLLNSWVTVGQRVERGTPLGQEGNTGQVYSASGLGNGAHVDYRVMDIYKRFISPYQFING